MAESHAPLYLSKLNLGCPDCPALFSIGSPCLRRAAALRGALQTQIKLMMRHHIVNLLFRRLAGLRVVSDGRTWAKLFQIWYRRCGRPLARMQ